MGKKTKPNNIVPNVPTSIFQCLKFGQSSLRVTYKELFYIEILSARGSKLGLLLP